MRFQSDPGQNFTELSSSREQLTYEWETHPEIAV